MEYASGEPGRLGDRGKEKGSDGGRLFTTSKAHRPLLFTMPNKFTEPALLL